MNSAIDNELLTINLIKISKVLVMYSIFCREVLDFSIYSELLTINSAIIGGEMMICSKVKGGYDYKLWTHDYAIDNEALAMNSTIKSKE